jgi:hypothetical protein
MQLPNLPNLPIELILEIYNYSDIDTKIKIKL